MSLRVQVQERGRQRTCKQAKEILLEIKNQLKGGDGTVSSE